MQARHWKRRTIAVRLSGLLILLLVVCTSLPPAPTAPGIDSVNRLDPSLTDGGWTATFHHAGLQQQGTLTATTSGCRMSLAGSTPSTIVLDRIIEQPIGPNRRLQVYAGWPRNAEGQISGVRNQSRDPTSAHIVENKLGPTIVWAIAGCQHVCVKGIVLRYDMTIAHGGDMIAITRIDTPIADGCAQVDTCLTPVFRTNPRVNTIQYAGAIDQPGCTISEVGDGFCDAAGRRYTVLPGDQLDLTFKHRALIICDSDVIGVMDWGYRLTAPLGQMANQITPEILEDVVIDLARKDDPNPIKRAQFAQALAAAQKLLRSPLRQHILQLPSP